MNDEVVDFIAKLKAAKESGARQPAAVDPGPLSVVNAALLAGEPVPQREWLVPDVIPLNRVTLLSGNGGDGKSLLMLQLAVATATGTNWIGHSPRQGSVIVASAEDELGEVHRRLADITRNRDDVSMETLDGLGIVDLSAAAALLAVLDGRVGTLSETPLLHRLDELIATLQPSLLILDALADLYGGDENVRVQVRQFIAFLRRRCLEHSVTIIVVAHPSLTGMASNSGLSGSTGWNNSVRCRLYLEPVRDKDGDEDAFLRQLTIKKNNRGPAGTVVQLEWSEGRFRLISGIPSGRREAAIQHAESVFLKLLAIFRGQGRDVSPSASRSYAPSVFSKHPEAGGLKSQQLGLAMDRLLGKGKIKIESYGPPSKRASRLVAVG